ncbi:MAG: hypothetical protein KIB40_03650 [Pantoea sp.]|uniref:hypothetical protein n=1 Tax=Pantoea sp. TaxID=69393 RepID=UPI00257E8BC9|nr:hypothetical protein [Pantoea sp.]MBS6032241.1 hypothetical protein [Pantoea sp.]
MENSKLSNVKGKELVAAGHAFAKAIGMDTPLIEVAKMVSELATRLDCALVRGDELQKERDALAAENVALLTRLRNIIDIVSKADNRYCMCGESMDSHSLGGCGSPIGMLDYHFGKLTDENPETPATDAYLNSVRAEGAIAVRDALVLAEDGADIYATSTLVANQLRAGEPS